MAARSVHGGRALLNLEGHHSTAAIVAEVPDTGDRKVTSEDTAYTIEPEVTVAISDCDKAVRLEFDLATANQLENGLYKIDTIIETLEAFREGLIVEHHRFHDRIESHTNPNLLYHHKNSIGKRSKFRPEGGA